MNRRRYQLPYEDPGQRRPWVPYHQWVAQREAERMRVPGALRNDRAYYAEQNRLYPVPRAEMRRQQNRARDARQDEELLEPEVRREMYRRALEKRRAKWKVMHKTAQRLYDVPRPRGEEEDPLYQVKMEEYFDAAHGDYGGRFEEFLYQGEEEEPAEAFKRLREDDEVANLPVIDPKKVKFVDE